MDTGLIKVIRCSLTPKIIMKLRKGRLKIHLNLTQTTLPTLNSFKLPIISSGGKHPRNKENRGRRKSSSLDMLETEIFKQIEQGIKEVEDQNTTESASEELS